MDSQIPTCSKYTLAWDSQKENEDHALAYHIRQPYNASDKCLPLSPVLQTPDVEGKNQTQQGNALTPAMQIMPTNIKVLSEKSKESRNMLEYRCKYCQPVCKTTSGLKVHLKACKSKKLKMNSNNDTIILTSTVNSNKVNSNKVNAVFRDAKTTFAENETIFFYVWGSHTKDDIFQIINATYEEVVFWRKNLFMLPSGQAGKSFIKEMTKMIEMWNNDGNLKDICLKAAMVMPALILQKPTFKSKSKEHSACLSRRMKLWLEGDFDSLMKESRTIQNVLSIKYKKYTLPQISKTFAKLMLKGKVNAALRLLDQQESSGILPLSDDVLDDLKSKHPKASATDDSIMLKGELPFTDPVMFAGIDESAVSKAALRTKGAAGPSGLDSDNWRRILISKNYASHGKDLRTAIAKMTQKLCTQKVEINKEGRTNPEVYTACRLIPLDKNPGVRPIGVSEVLRRIIGKVIIDTISPEILKSAGPLQLCAGQQAGCEAAVHAMNDIFQEEQTDAILLVDASNAFNSINRKAMLHNIPYICPPMGIYAYNSYITPSRLFVQGGKEITSSEGTTQGDSFAMAMYAIGITPLFQHIRDETTINIKQVAFADDLGGAGRLVQLKSWWNKILHYGPLLGYYPKPSKSWLITKPNNLATAEQLFNSTEINITTDGQKYLGGYIGSDSSKAIYMQEKINKWIKQLEMLSMIAKHEPQAAYSSFTAGFKHRFTYHTRVMSDIDHLLKQIDHIIDTKFLPAITEEQVISPLDRKLISLPVRLGGLGIPIFSEMSNESNSNSKSIYALLIHEIKSQNEISSLDLDIPSQKSARTAIKQQLNHKQKHVLDEIRSKMSIEQKLANDISQLKGSSSWLTSLPLAQEGYVLNKREFLTQ